MPTGSHERISAIRIDVNDKTVIHSAIDKSNLNKQM